MQLRTLLLPLGIALLTAASAPAQLVISEFMASNTKSLADEDKSYEDWIEIYNPGATPVNLGGWYLTDSPDNLKRWTFPATNLNGGGFMVVFASGKNRTVPGAPLHTDFRLGSSGDYLALVKPDGVTIATEFAPKFPAQFANVSYGYGISNVTTVLVASNAPGRILIPTDGSVDGSWMTPSFNDSAWQAATNGIGYDTNISDPAEGSHSGEILTAAPLVYYRFNETAGTTAANQGSMGTPGNGTYRGGFTLNVAGPRPPQFNNLEADNRAVQFNGIDGSVGGPAGLLNSRPTFSMVGWIRPTAAQANRTGLFGQNDNVEFGFINAGTLQLWTSVGQIDMAYPFANNEWHHVAVIGTGTQLQIYLDSVLRSTTAQGGPLGTSGFNFNIGGGGVFDASGNPFVGQMDEVAFWPRALTSNELGRIYASGSGSPVDFSPEIATDLRTRMLNVNAGAYLRLPFVVDDPSSVARLTLRAKYDDGFVAYLNGQRVASANAPEAPAWNSSAGSRHGDNLAVAYEDFNLSLNFVGLTGGTNVLAIHALNIHATNTDFLFKGEVVATLSGTLGQEPRYFVTPTPGDINGTGSADLGPIVSGADHSPRVPTTGQSLLVTALVSRAFAPVDSVRLFYLANFGTTNSTPMFDDGAHGDGLAGDGIFGAMIPGNTATNGQMLRYRISATDTLGRASRWPLFEDPLASPEYLGTVVAPDYVTSKLPIFHLFVSPQHLAGIDTEAGGRVAVFYDGEFYDNVSMEIRGNTSASQTKKSHRLEFNRGHLFRHLPEFPRIRKTSLMAEFLDPAYLRQHLSFWLLEQMGVPSPFFYPVRAQMNGAFYALVYHNDVIDEEQVARMGYDPAGAIYKAAGNCLPSESSTGVFQKKTEPLGDHSDYQAMVRAINETNTVAGRRAAAFDMLDIPEIVNYLAGARWCAENDDVWANMSLYRDVTNGTGDGLWRIIPFDMNASWGQRYGGITPLDAINDNCKSHPLYGGSTIIACDGSSYNRIYDIIIALPETRQMLLRRQRTVLDRWVMEPGVAPESRLLETHIRYMTNLFWTEAFLDRAKWGYSTWTASNKPLTNAVTELFNEFINLRRTHFSVTHNVTNTAKPVGLSPSSNAGIPQSQPANPTLLITGLDYNPASANQAQEYICITNPTSLALDISGWQIEGGVTFRFKAGTIVPATNVVYVSPSIPAFRSRMTAPRGGQGLFVVGPYRGQLSARGESVRLLNEAGQTVHTFTYPGTPSLAQQYLRLTELMYHPVPEPGSGLSAEEFEYVELMNTSASLTLDLSGVRFVNGIEFNFTGSAITNLAPGASVVVVRNPAAFTARHGTGLPVAGMFTHALDNAGERIQLVDATGEEILDFSYNNSWYPITDGLGFSLVIRDPLASFSTWGDRESWRASGTPGGSPGASDPIPPATPVVLVNEALTASVAPAVDFVELHNPGPADAPIGGWFLTDDFFEPRKYRFPDGTTVPAGGFLVVPETAFNSGDAAFALGADGDDVWLFAADAAGNLTGYYHGFDFGAAEAGVTFGRHVNSQGTGYFVPQSAATPGATNAGPKIGPLVISEVMYHPAGAAGADNTLEEFIEVENVSGASLALFDALAPTNTWRLRNAVDFDFPPDTALPAGGRALIVGFDPAADPAALAQFRATYELPNTVTVLGPWSGKLDNSSESLELKKPGVATSGGTPYILVERIDYQQSAPWPPNADGEGSSLQRLAANSFGNDPASWFAAGITPGSANVFNVNPTITLTAPVDGGRYILPTNVVFSALPADTDGTIVRVEFFVDGVKAGDATSAPYTFTWSAASFGTHVVTARAKDNLLGVAWSAAATIEIASLPPVVSLTAPTPGTIVSAGQVVNLAATAADPDGTVTNVVFQVDGTTVGEDATAPYAAAWTATPGPHQLTALAIDNSGARTVSAAISLFAAAQLTTNLTVIASNSVWRYVETHTNPPASWTSLEFDDSAWKSGPAQLGFGDNDESTRLTNIVIVAGVTNRLITHYFRHVVTIDSLVGVTNSILSVLRDDGAVGYINGVEVYRSNMATGRISNTNLATAAVSGNAENIFFPTNVPAGLLRVGSNVIAVEVHQNIASSPDMSFAAQLVLQRSVRGPAITQQPESRTNAPGETAVFQVTADGGDPLAYQWFFEGAPLAGATGSTLSLPDVLAASAGRYLVVVTNLAGAATSSIARLTVQSGDTDGDGLPDDWELANGTNPNVPDAGVDADLDGHTNGQEYLAGTNPLDPASVLRITTIAVTPGGATAVLTFPAVANHTYSILSRPQVAAGAWLKVADIPAIGASGPATVTNAVPGADRLFYRIVTPQQP